MGYCSHCYLNDLPGLKCPIFEDKKRVFEPLGYVIYFSASVASAFSSAL